ncbi:MAG: hemerythrin family protein [Alphaproteobacteria bacterium]|nr:hemerythrin family protein [Rhodospirillales bacterium]MCW9045155.1 hemerythrin family protein [Alphaproteobacteria bacterium]
MTADMTIYEEMQSGDIATFRQRLTDALPDVGAEVLNDSHMGLLSIFFSFQRTMDTLRQGTPTSEDWEKIGYDLEALSQLIENHFKQEEEMMESCGHGYVTAHKAEHNVFTRKVKGYCAAIESHDVKKIFGLKYDLFEMFMHHITVTDMKYKDDIKRA